MAAQEYQYIDDILKEMYAPLLMNQAYLNAPFWAQIQQRPVTTFYGRRLVLPIQVAFTEAVATRIANNYTLPTAQRNYYDTSYLYMKRMYGRVQVDGFSIAATQGRGSWIEVLSQEMKGVMSAYGLSMDRQSLGKGRAILALVSSVVTPAITVKDPHEITGDTPAAKYFRKGMVLDVHDTANSTKHVDSNLIASISGAVLTMTDAVSGAAVGDVISREDSITHTAGALADSADLMGIDGIIDSANAPITASDFQGIDRSAEPTWQAYVNANSRVISETYIQEDLDEIEKVSTGSPVNFGLTTHLLRNKLIDIVRGDRMVESLKLNAGWSAIKYTGGNVELPIMAHKNVPTGYLYYISMPHIKFYSLKKLVWDNRGGGIIKPVADADKYEAWFKVYSNIGTDCSNAHGKATLFTPA